MKKLFILFLALLFAVICSGYGEKLLDKATDTYASIIAETEKEGTVDVFDSTKKNYFDFNQNIDSVQFTEIETTAEAVELVPFDSNVIELSKDIKEKADAISKKYNSVGVQIAVMEEGKLLHTYEYGYANTESKTLVTNETKFRIASLSKLAADMVFMCLCDKGMAAIDADISSYLGYTVRNPYFPDVVITPAMLMSHSGTVIDSATALNSIVGRSSMSMSALLTSPSTFLAIKPGTFYSYSNFSVATVGAICEMICQKHFNEIAKECLFEPLEIDASFLAGELKNTDLIATLYGGGGLVVSRQTAAAHSEQLGQTHHIVQGNLTISAKDYLEILSVLCNGGVTDTGKTVISQNSISEMLKARIYCPENLGSGFGVEENKALIQNKTVYTHTGDSYGMYSFFAFDPATDSGIVIITSGASVTYLEGRGVYNNCSEYVELLYPKTQK